MSAGIVFDGVCKSYAGVRALDGVDLCLEPGRVIGLVGRNGSGKSTLMNLVAGLVLPSAGSVRVLGTSAGELGDAELARLGFVHQESRFLGWMKVREHVDYVASFYSSWDRHLAGRLVSELDLDPEARVQTLSPGNVQKLALVLALGHRPELLLLDEPVSALDPLAREALLGLLLELVGEGDLTAIVSSHVLRDVERVVDWIVCLDRGRVIVDAALDELRERYSEWRVHSRNGGLPARFPEPFVLAQEGDAHRASVFVVDAAGESAAFAQRHHLDLEVHPVNLESMFPLWTSGGVR